MKRASQYSTYIWCFCCLYEGNKSFELHVLRDLFCYNGHAWLIVNLLKYAKKEKLFTIGFSGFNGGYLKKNSNISIHIDANNYGISEDSHHILMHLILQYMIKKLEDRKKHIK